MALERTQLQTVGTLYYQTQELYDLLDSFLIHVEHKSPRDVIGLQTCIARADYILKSWFFKPRLENLLESGLGPELQFDVIVLLSAARQMFQPFIDNSPNFDTNGVEKIELRSPVTFIELMVAFESMVGVLAQCLLAILAQESVAPNQDTKKIFANHSEFLTWCGKLKQVEQLASSKDWAGLEAALVTGFFPDSLRQAVANRDETSFWFSPWQFKQWRELYSVSELRFREELVPMFYGLLEIERESHYKNRTGYYQSGE